MFNGRKINTVIKGTYGKERKYTLINRLPEIGDCIDLMEELTVVEIIEVNDVVAETTSGNPCHDYDFYRLTIDQGDDLDQYYEYVCIEKKD